MTTWAATAGAEAVVVAADSDAAVALSGGGRLGFQGREFAVAGGRLSAPGGLVNLSLSAGWEGAPPRADACRLVVTVIPKNGESYNALDTGSSGPANPITAAGLAHMSTGATLEVRAFNLTGDALTLDFVQLDIHTVL